MEEKKKSSTGIILLVVILLVACAIMGAFIYVNKDKLTATTTKEESSKKTTNDSNCKEQKVYGTMDDEITTIVKNIFRDGHPCSEQIEYLTTDKKVEAKDVGMQEAYTMAEYEYYVNNTQSISLDEFTKKVQKILGKDYKFDPTGVNYNGASCPQYNYNKDTKTFNKQVTACGGTCGPYSTSYRIVKAVDNDGKLEVTAKVVFINNDAFYSDYAKTKEIAKIRYDSGYELSDDVFAKGGTYLFTFNKEDGNYVFVSSEPVQ